MRRTVSIHLGEEARPLGRLRYDQQGARESATFEYDASWLAAIDRFAIDPGLPLVAGPQFHRKVRDGSVFPAAIADTEPDGWGRRVIQRDHAKRRQEARRAGRAVEAHPLNAMDYLLAVDDVSRVDALRFQDEDGRYQRTVDDGRRTTPPLIELAQLLAATRAVETNTETEADLAYLRGRGTSLGGLRPKCSVIDERGWLSIGKFPSVADERPVTKGEVLAMRLARKAGIDAAEARLIDSDGAPVALIRRFDRTGNGARLMYVSAATMLGAEPGDPGEHSYTELVDALRQHGSQPAADIEELWRRIAFSILITNVDDHLLNHGFLHVDRGQWRLAPAFDVNPFPERVRELKTWVSEEAGPEATIDALMSVTAYFRIASARAKAILAEVEAAVTTWREEGLALGMTSEDLASFADAFEHDERQAAKAVLR
ncbi:type II toxin-antitoxin system HipA family toxin [Xanthobacter autotrophicus]|uniref:type II toxin-antitoxin system HipA family toxin n=1 Tax=Xanthobacter autotrophicus TaxID=280 RepID=UPI00372AF659